MTEMKELQAEIELLQGLRAEQKRICSRMRLPKETIVRIEGRALGLFMGSILAAMDIVKAPDELVQTFISGHMEGVTEVLGVDHALVKDLRTKMDAAFR